jgi:hypothetical protein
MYHETLIDAKENRISEDNKPYVEKILSLLLGCGVDEALTILYATRRIIVNAYNPKTIDEDLITEAKKILG